MKLLTDNFIYILVVIVVIAGYWINSSFWKGYRQGFSEGVLAGYKKQKDEFDRWISDGSIDAIIDRHLDKDELVQSTISKAAKLVIAANTAWKKHGTSGDQLDQALKQFLDTTDKSMYMPAPCEGMAQNCQWVDGVSTHCSCMDKS